MTVLFLFALLIVGAFDDGLEKKFDDQMYECIHILDFVQGFYDELPINDIRRRLADYPEDDGENTEQCVRKSLDTCMAVVVVVNNFWKNLEASELVSDAGDPREDPIILNVGGTNFSTTRATLRTESGTFFEKKFRWSNTTCSEDGTFFIDRNPTTFEYILEFLRAGDIIVESRDTDLRLQLLEDAEFFELSEELEVYLRYSALSGIDLSLSEVNWLNKELPGNYKMGGLLFDTSVDGDAASTFHSRCDGKGPTVTLVETSLGVVFGGYTDVSWASGSGSWGWDNDAFVFTLRPSPQKFLVSSASTAIYRHSSFGPQFGNVAFRIYTNCQKKAVSIVNYGSYHDIGSYILNNGHHDFRVNEYAVVQAN